MSAHPPQSGRSVRRASALTVSLASLLLVTSCGGGGGGRSSSSSGPPPGPQPLSIITTTLDDARNGELYFEYIESSGGTEPFTWTLVSGQVPPGLSFEPLGLGVRISGAAAESGQFQLVVQVTDSQLQTASRTMNLRVVEPLRITSPFSVNATLNQPLSHAIQTIGGTTPLTWSVVGNPPPTV